MPAYDNDGFSPPAAVARVVLRHPDTDASVSDVRMVIDSGADATLLPRSAVSALGLTGLGTRYELLAFDGTSSESEAVPAVLVFLNKSFRGQIDSDVEVIGRNVLNRVRLWLDGPSLTWDEWTPAHRPT
jgi:hypothetical protein